MNGLFIPNLLIGAAFGRLVGQFINQYIPSLGIDPGTFALMGSAAFLGTYIISLFLLSTHVTD